jgi:hypothetical protein
MRRPPGNSSLRPAERESYAFACADAAGNVHWVRVFESSIVRRTLVGRLGASDGRRLETATGSAVHPIDVGLYLVYCERTLEWIEVEALELTAVRRVN